MSDDDELVASWSRSKRAEGRSQATIDAYENDTLKLAGFLVERGRTLASAQRSDLEACLVDGRDSNLAPATLARRFRSWQQFYKWAAEEDEVDVNPMAKMKPPKVAAPLVPVITVDQLKKLLDECAKPRQRPGRAATKPDRSTFENRRDTALVLLLATTGVRAGEIMGLHLPDVDQNAETFTVMGKGGRARVVALLPKPADAVDKYLRARRRHPKASTSTALWLGDKGPLTDSGLRQLLERRCDGAGIEHINPHRFRHTFAHEAKSRGMSDGDLMAIAGWQSPQMLHRYGASAGADRARESHRRIFGNV